MYLICTLQIYNNFLDWQNLFYFFCYLYLFLISFWVRIFFFECPNFFLSVPIFFYFFWYIKKIVYLCQTN